MLWKGGSIFRIMQFDKFPILLDTRLSSALWNLWITLDDLTMKCEGYTLHNLQPVEGNSTAPLRYNNCHKLQHTSMVIHTHIHQQV